MNSVQIMGNLTRDPQVRYTQTGRAVASFSVAVNRNYTAPNGEQKQLTDFVNVVAWGPLAEAAGAQLKKATRVLVDGRYSTRSYEAQDGQKRYVTEVTANVIALPLQTKKAEESYSQPPQGNVQTGNFQRFGAQTPSYDQEDIPF